MKYSLAMIFFLFNVVNCGFVRARFYLLDTGHNYYDVDCNQKVF